MRTFLLISLIAVGFGFGVSQVASAVCVQNGNTPGGGNIINCPAPVQNTPVNIGTVPGTTDLSDEVTVQEGGGVDVAGDEAINLEDGDDFITVNGGSVISSDDSAINGSFGNDTYTINGGTIMAGGGQAIQDFEGSNTIVVNGGTLEGFLQAIDTSDGSQFITINGGTLRVIEIDVIETGNSNDILTVNGGILDASNPGANEILDVRSGDDLVFLNGGTYFRGDDDDAVDLAQGNDTLTFGGDIDLDGGLVDCGPGFDTIEFAMDVPQEAVNLISSQIVGQNPQNGSVVINDITYEWINCELLVPDLNGVRIVRPIPTLSQWGLIAMAGVLGIMGLLAVRRKTVSA